MRTGSDGAYLRFTLSSVSPSTSLVWSESFLIRLFCCRPPSHTQKKNEIKRLRRRKIGPPFFRAEFSRRLASNENEKGADDTKIVIKRFHSMGGSNGTTPRCDRGKRKRSTERGAKGDRTEKRGPSFIGRDISHSTPQMRCSSWRKKRKSKKKRKTKRGTEREREIR